MFQIPKSYLSEQTLLLHHFETRPEKKHPYYKVQKQINREFSSYNILFIKHSYIVPV